MKISCYEERLAYLLDQGQRLQTFPLCLVQPSSLHIHIGQPVHDANGSSQVKSFSRLLLRLKQALDQIGTLSQEKLDEQEGEVESYHLPACLLVLDQALDLLG